jgi:hypothetical protein
MSTVFWDITLCSPLKVNRRLGGTYRFHLQGRRISKKPERNQVASIPWRWRRHVPPKRQLSSNPHAKRTVTSDASCWVPRVGLPLLPSLSLWLTLAPSFQQCWLMMVIDWEGRKIDSGCQLPPTPRWLLAPNPSPSTLPTDHHHQPT